MIAGYSHNSNDIVIDLHNVTVDWSKQSCDIIQMIHSFKYDIHMWCPEVAVSAGGCRPSVNISTKGQLVECHVNNHASPFLLYNQLLQC